MSKDNNRMKTLQQRRRVGTLIGKYGVYFALVVMFVAMSFASPTFLTVTNLFNILKQNAVIGIISVGMTFVIVTGGIDLSVGAIVAMAACFGTSLAQKGTATPTAVAYLVGVLAGIACGAFSGLFIAHFHLPAFIATLATQTIVRGIVYVFTDGRPITGVTDAYKVIGRSSWGFLPIAVVIYAVFIAAGIFFLSYTKFGRHVYAIGGNKKAAIVSGVNAKLTEFMVYVISGFTAACAGVLLSSRIQTGQPAGGQGPARWGGHGGAGPVARCRRGASTRARSARAHRALAVTARGTPGRVPARHGCHSLPRRRSRRPEAARRRALLAPAR